MDTAVIEVTGFITKDVQVNQTKKEIDVTTFIVAVNNCSKKTENNTATFIPVEAWGKIAKGCEGITKGSRIKISGGMKQENFTRNGAPASRLKVIAKEITILKAKIAEPKEEVKA